MVEGENSQSIIVAAPAEPAKTEPDRTRRSRKNWKTTEWPVDVERSKRKAAQNQPITVADGMPPFKLFLLGFTTVFGSAMFPFLLGTVDVVSGDFPLYDFLYDNVCCFLCNGIAVGLGIIGYYCIQYGNWEANNGGNYSAVFMYVSAGLLTFAGIASIWIWSQVPNW